MVGGGDFNPRGRGEELSVEGTLTQGKVQA